MVCIHTRVSSPPPSRKWITQSPSSPGAEPVDMSVELFRLHPEVVMQDYPNIKATESPASWVSRYMGIAQFHPTVQEVPLQECLRSKDSTQERCGGALVFVGDQLSGWFGSPEHHCVTRWLKCTLVCSLSSPPHPASL